MADDLLITDDTPPLVDDVASLLEFSRAAHVRARELRHAKRSTAARVALVLARDLRQHAHAADPTHADPAWTDSAETALVPRGVEPHAALLAFYAQQLGDDVR